VEADNAERVRSLVAQADALIGVRRYREANERARQAAALAPHDPRVFSSLSRAQFGLGDYADAVQTAKERIRLDPTSSVGFQLQAAALTALAKRQHGTERTRLGDEAVAAAREAVRLGPRDPNAHIRLAEACCVARHAQEAHDAVEEAIRLAPNSAGTWVAASLVAIAVKKWQVAISASQKALAIDPSNYAATNNLGVALRGAGKRRRGIRVFAEAARIDPDAPTARNNLTRTGVNVARIVIMVLLIPIGFIAHIGLALYIVFALASNVLISRYPDTVNRMERWAVPIVLFFTRSDSDGDLAESVPQVSWEEVTANAAWPETAPRDYAGPALVVVAIFTWAMTAIIILVAVKFGSPGADKFVLAGVALGLAALAMWPTLVLRNRRRAMKTTNQES
jgi:tetratricopeptide (TPR) repeat protein